MHPIDDIGEFIIDDSLMVDGEVIADNLVESKIPGRKRVETCVINSNGTFGNTNCNSWLTNSLRAGAGIYNLTVDPSVFSSTNPPTCVTNMNVVTGYNYLCTAHIIGVGAVNISAKCYSGISGSGADGTLSLICMGREP